jgi:protein-disulfide isomerase
MYGLIAAAVIVAAVAVYIIFIRPSSSAVPEGGSSPTAITVKPTDIVRGSPNAPIVMLEYASMTCPHCARWEKEVMPKLVENYINTGKVRYIFREFPLDGAARMASALARCEAGDNFYAFIDLLFLNQNQWIKDFNGDNQISREDVIQGLTQMGRVAGMTQQQVETCANDPKNLAIVDQNLQEAQTLYNVNSTPNFVLGDEVHRGEWAWNELDAKLKSMLAHH